MPAFASPVTFKPCPLGRETVWLGNVLIGQVGLIPKRGAAAWLFLPQVPSRMWSARSIEEAKSIIKREVEIWLDAAELMPAREQRRRA